MNRAGLGVISRELVDQSVVQGCGFDSGTREARVPIPRTLTLLDIPESGGRKRRTGVFPNGRRRSPTEEHREELHQKVEGAAVARKTRSALFV